LVSQGAMLAIAWRDQGNPWEILGKVGVPAETQTGNLMNTHQTTYSLSPINRYLTYKHPKVTEFESRFKNKEPFY
jgi:hypothetical protein